MDTYLEHHGILGQKWGVRRFQNPDGTLTEAGKKKYAKSIVTSERKRINSANPYIRSEEFKNDIREKVKSTKTITDGDVNTLMALRNKDQKAWERYYDNDYFDSEQCVNDSAKAYNDTLSYFEKYEKEYLDEIVKLNGGDKASLDQYHRFRKLFEGYEDEAWTQGQKEWDKTHNTKQLEKEAKAASKAYQDACKKVGEKLFGEYGNMTITEASKYISGTTLNDEVGSIISSLIDEQYVESKKGAK